MAGTAELNAFKLIYVVSPILLVGGVASSIPGGILPIILLLQAGTFISGLLSSGTASLSSTVDNYFAYFSTIPGSTLIDQDLGRYPFGSQQIAANAVIAQPLAISLMMTCPVRGGSGYITKLATLTALQTVLQQHNASGGLYNVMTPAGIYTNCLLRRLEDASAGEDAQEQFMYRWDFEQPLVTLAQAASAQNSLMSSFTNQTQIQGQPSLSGGSPTIGPSSSLATPATVPAATPLPGSSILGGIA